jgi:hypothetical protein
MKVFSRVGRGMGVAGAGVALLLLAGPAYAAGATDGLVAAAVTGTVSVSTTPCTPTNPLPAAIPSRAGTVGTFGDVAIAGAWATTAGPAAFVGSVGVSDVSACVSAIGNPPAAVPGLVNQGSLGSATYSGTLVNSISGGLDAGGQFVQAGLVAVALIQTDYTITGATSGSASNVPLVAVIGVAPLGSVGVGAADIVAGPVVG